MSRRNNLGPPSTGVCHVQIPREGKAGNGGKAEDMKEGEGVESEKRRKRGGRERRGARRGDDRLWPVLTNSLIRH